MNQYLTFAIAEQQCAVEIENVESVLDSEELSPIPGAPAYVRGLLSLRGDAVPVVDVRKKLGLAEDASRRGSIVVLGFEGEGKKKLVGALVDEVCEVVEVPVEAIDPIEDFVVAFDRKVVSGIGKRDGAFLAMIDVERLFDRGHLDIDL